MPEFQIRIEGLEELRRGLRRVDDKLGKELGQVNKSIGGQVVRWAEDRRSQMAAQYPSYRSGIVSIRASANQRRVEVNVRPATAEGGTRAHPVFGEWMNQSLFARKVWPERSLDGWLVRPAVDDHRARIEDEYVEAVVKLVNRVIGSG